MDTLSATVSELTAEAVSFEILVSTREVVDLRHD